MKKLMVVLFCSFLLSACFLAYHEDVQQGNILNPNKVAQIKTGMSSEQVRFLLGDPVLTNTFNDHDIEYVYTLQPEHGPFESKRLILHFEGNRITRISKN